MWLTAHIDRHSQIAEINETNVIKNNWILASKSTLKEK